MHTDKMPGKLTRFLKSIYFKLVRIDDTPQKIAIGFALGVFAGVMPLAGPIAALFLAFLFRVNRASALLGSLLTNTWLSIVSFLLAIKIGSFIFGVDRETIRLQWTALLKDFHIAALFKLSALKIILPVATGYIAIALSLALTAYLVSFICITLIKNRKNM